MPENIEEKLKQFASILENPDSRNGLRNLVEGLAPGVMGAFQDSGTSRQSQPLVPENVLSRFGEIGSMLNNVQDSRISLLRAMHPFLSPNRQDRCDTCIQFLKFLFVVNALTGLNLQGIIGKR